MKVLLKLTHALLKFAGTLVLVLAVVVLIGIYLNHRAEQRSAEFCESIVVGTDLSGVVSHASQLGIRHYQNNDADQHHFMFPGFVFNWSDCIVKVREGLVTQKWTTPAQD